MQANTCSVLPIAIGDKCACTKTIDNAGMMDINAGYVNATFERLLCKCISRGFFIRLTLDFAFCTYNDGIAMGSGPVGLGKPPS